MASRLRLIGTFALFLTPALLAATPQPASLVNPLIGTDPNPIYKGGWSWDTGNVFPGAVCPRGMVAWSPDTTHQDKIAGGYWYPDSKIEAFSLTHFSGRGVPCLKDISVMPIAGDVATSPGTDWKQFAAGFNHQNESASPGFYRVKFDNGIETQLTATPRTGLATFHFPAQSPARLLIRANGAVAVNGSEVTGHDDAKVPGSGMYHVYFVAQFDKPASTSKTWAMDKISDSATAEANHCGAILTFDRPADGIIKCRIGISYTSLENARDNLAKENTGWDFAAVRDAAVAMWNTELNRIQVDGGTDSQRQTFYTALYHCYMHPNILDDVNGQYLGIDGKTHTVAAGHHQYQNIPAWDQHRSHSPLMAILANSETADVMQSLVNYAQQDAAVRPDGGGLPRWQQVNRNSSGMVGDGDDSIIATSYAFGVNHFDTKAALAAMDKGASQPGTTSDSKKVRAGLEQYLSDGYVPNEASVTLEYCTDDFALAQYAKSLGDNEKYQTYLKRAQSWKKSFDPATGYIRPHTAKGDWLEPFSPASGKGFVEGSMAQYLWMVNFNYRSLIDQLGGNEKTIARLDDFFTQIDAGLGSKYAWMGNEPCEEAPWVYDFAGAPAKTQQLVRRIQNELFTAAPSGIPGNDDAGALSSWYVFSALGIYPEIPGVAGFVTGSPLFSKATIHLENGKVIEITADNAHTKNPFVQSLKVNAQPHDSAWIPWSMLSDGGSLNFTLGDKASTWASDPKDVPPSFDVEK